MKRTIFKFPLELANTQRIAIPKEAEVMCVQAQGNQPVMYVHLDAAELAKEPRTFRTFGTGHPIPEEEALEYIGTYQLDGGALVFHVFEVVEAESET